MDLKELVTIYQGSYSEPFNLDLIELPYELDHFQKFAIDGMRRGENVLVCVSTGSGKTTVARYRIALSLARGERVIYTSPIKSLSNQKYDEFRSWFGQDNVGIMTGDIKFNPEAPCVIMTTEILRNYLLAKARNQDGTEITALTKVTSVIFDEVHYINNRDRGGVWETCLMALQPQINLVMLSATINHPEKLAEWLAGLKGVPLRLILVPHRQVPLTHYVYDSDQDEIILYLTSEGHFRAPPFATLTPKVAPVHLLGQMMLYAREHHLFPALVFCFSRKKCETYAQSIQIPLVSVEKSQKIGQLFDSLLRETGNHYQNLEMTIRLRECLLRGVAYHHAGLIPNLKEIIEKIFAKGWIRVLFATETFAVGVNMPTKTVIFVELTKYDGYRQDHRPLESDEYIQMSGRAGRRGLDPIGTVIYLPLKNSISVAELRHMATGQLGSIVSKFKLDYRFVLQNDLTNPRDILGKTLVQRERDQLLNTLTPETEPVSPPLVDEVQEWLTMSEKVHSARPNQRKKMTQRLAHLVNSPGVQNYQNYLLRMDAYRSYQTQKQYIMDGLYREYRELFDRLVNKDYIKLPETDDGVPYLTIKGVVASHINQCNELLLTEAVTRGIFEGLEMRGLATVLGLFIEERNHDLDHDYQHLSAQVNGLRLPEEIKTRIHRMIQLVPELEKLYMVEGVSLDWGLHLEMLEAIYLWADPEMTLSGLFRELPELDIYLGNFVKDMTNLCHLGETLSQMGELFEYHAMVRQLAPMESVIMRDIVTTNSLYVNL